ncbi:MAG: antitoxin family protein [Nitrospirae bacterium]|nr:antitoxin family protein [Nitrospirota bacterium]
MKVIHEDSVLRPLEKINLKEHQQIEILIEEMESLTKKSQGIVKATSDVIEEVVLNPDTL